MHLYLATGLFPSRFPTKYSTHISSDPCALWRENLKHFDHHQHIWWSVQISKLLSSVLIPPLVCFFFSLFHIHSETVPQMPMLCTIPSEREDKLHSRKTKGNFKKFWRLEMFNFIDHMIKYRSTWKGVTASTPFCTCNPFPLCTSLITEIQYPCDLTLKSDNHSVRLYT